MAIKKLQKKECSASQISPATSAEQRLILDAELRKLSMVKPAADQRAAVTDACERVRSEHGDKPPDQTIATPEEVSSSAITEMRVLLAGPRCKKTSQIDFYAEEPSELQVIEAGQRVKVATDLVTCKILPKHNNPPAQPTIAFDHVLADFETKMQLQYIVLQSTLIQIAKRDWLSTLKFNTRTFISIYERIYKVNVTQALIDTTEQRNLLKTQPSPVKCPEYDNYMLRSLQVLPQTEGALLASVNTLLTKIVVFT
ncbi:MAG: hypothetical protein EZS28_022954 [Streblomastix strix]|uniref:Uncharacterized protein n=1 Tax=Streblomastix strix TaxID=222440 RepID=A0A5J4VGK8_9EUKA|nr:MAG: hypothetical protein EZS28_022954 [Streblomastix strix]